MRIVALVHFAVPYRNAGSETMLHAMLRHAAEAGHEVTVVATHLPDAPHHYVYDGVEVITGNIVTAQQHVRELHPDVLISHHDNTKRAHRLSHKLGVPLVFLMHNDFPATSQMLSLTPDLVVFNTRWMAHKFRNYTGRGIVVHPPVWAEQHRTTPGDAVTLVNLNDHKGGGILYDLADMLPEVKFLGVVGGHGEQIIREKPNVEIVAHTDNMARDVWSRTRLLIMPSIYESYGMTAVEAMASGIPVAANPTPGLLESLSYAGMFLPREDSDAWRRLVTVLEDPTRWAAASELATLRSAETDPRPELDAFVAELEVLVA